MAPKKKKEDNPQSQNSEEASLDSKKSFIKHILECNCILPQYKNYTPPIFHKFIVFSELKKDGTVRSSYINCNNCNVIHKITEAGKSEIQKKESSNTVPTITDIETNLPVWLSTFLKQNDCPLPTWQEAQFIIENELWGSFIVLSREVDKDNEEKSITKYVVIIGENLYKIKIDQEEDLDD